MRMRMEGLIMGAGFQEFAQMNRIEKHAGCLTGILQK
jgi:hypothetical protein